MISDPFGLSLRGTQRKPRTKFSAENELRALTTIAFIVFIVMSQSTPSNDKFVWKMSGAIIPANFWKIGWNVELYKLFDGSPASTVIEVGKLQWVGSN